MRHRRAAALAHGALVARMRMALERRIDGALRFCRRAPDEGEIAALAAALRPCSANCLLSARCAVSVLATTIRPLVSLSSRCTMPGRLTPPMPDRLSPQWAISALTSVPVRVAGGRMHDEAGRLVDDDQRVVLVDDSERNRFAVGLGLFGRRQIDGDSVAGIDVRRRIADRARRDLDLSVQDQRFEARARQRRNARGQHAVEALAGLFGGDNDGLSGVHGLGDVRRKTPQSRSRARNREGAPADDDRQRDHLHCGRRRAGRHRLSRFPHRGKGARIRRRQRGAAGRRQGALDGDRGRPHRGDHRGRGATSNCSPSTPTRSSRSGGSGCREPQEQPDEKACGVSVYAFAGRIGAGPIAHTEGSAAARRLPPALR